MYELRVQCQKLKGSMVVGGVPNTIVVLQAKDDGKDWIEIDKSEVVKHNSEPVFGKAFRLDKKSHKFIRFVVYETASSTKVTLKDKYILGEIELTVDKLLSITPYSRRLMFRNKCFARAGTITIFTEDLDASEKICHYKFSATGLDDKDTFSVSDPYFEMYKRLKDGSWELLHRSEVLTDTLNPNWREFELHDRVLLANNFTDQIKFVIFDYDDDGKHDFIGSSVVAVDDLMKSSDTVSEWPCLNQNKQYRNGESYVNSGNLVLNFCKVIDLGITRM